MTKFISALITMLAFSSVAQQPTQVVRGQIIDSETEFPLTDVKVQIFTSDTTLMLRTKTDIDGFFTINEVPVGKHQLVATYITYNLKEITIEVNSGKETVLNIPMQEKVLKKEEVVVTGRKKGEVINELALISAQQFSVSETDRYPGSRSDPARME